MELDFIPIFRYNWKNGGLFLYFGIDNLDQFTFQSIKVPIPNLQVPSDLESNGSKMVLK